MKLRLKFRDTFEVIQIHDDCSEINYILESVARKFNLNPSNVQISLNSKDYLGSEEGNKTISQIGIVNGDIIYVRSLQRLDDIKLLLDSEMSQQIVAVAKAFEVSISCPGIMPMIILLHISATAKKLILSTPESDVKSSINGTGLSLVRLTYNYPSGDNVKIIMNIYSTGNYFNISVGVCDLPIREQILIHRDSHFLNARVLDADVAKNTTLMYKNPSGLKIRLMDNLIEPLLLRVHEELKLEPRLHLLRLPSGILTSILLLLSLADLSRVFLTSRCLNCFISSSEYLWRINLARMEEKSMLIARAAMFRTKLLASHTVATFNQVESSTESDSNLSLSQKLAVESRSSSFEKFLVRYRSLASQRKHRPFNIFI